MTYDRDISKILIQAVSLAYQQFHYWHFNKSYNGDITQFPLFDSVFSEYTQVTSFESYLFRPKGKIYQDGDQGNQGKVNNTPMYFPYIGFILKSEINNIIAFRGGQTPYEDYQGIHFAQVPYVLGGKSYGKIASGISEMYLGLDTPSNNEQSLWDQILSSIEQLDPDIPCYVTGHSLGGPFAILTALNLIVNSKISANNVFMYNYGGSRLGDCTFAKFYDTQVPNSYRVVNKLDYAPHIPTVITPPFEGKFYFYKHVGQEWYFTINNAPPLLDNHLDIDYSQREPQVNPYYTAVINEEEKQR